MTYVMVIGLSGVIIRVITKSDFFHEYDYRPNWTKVNHKNYNFRGKKNSQVTKEWEICTKDECVYLEKKTSD